MAQEKGEILHGLMAEFKTPEALVEAAAKTKEEGYTVFDAFSPFPVHGLSDAMGFHCSKVPYSMLAGGLIGGISGMGFMIWASAIDYPLNVGGRPLLSIPSFIPVTFELTVLIASLTGVVVMFMLNGLPQPYHPVFNVKKFEKASNDGFFLCVESTDPKFDEAKTKKFLEGLGAEGVYDVES